MTKRSAEMVRKRGESATCIRSQAGASELVAWEGCLSAHRVLCGGALARCGWLEASAGERRRLPRIGRGRSREHAVARPRVVCLPGCTARDTDKLTSHAPPNSPAANALSSSRVCSSACSRLQRSRASPRPRARTATRRRTRAATSLSGRSIRTNAGLHGTAGQTARASTPRRPRPSSTSSTDSSSFRYHANACCTENTLYIKS